MRKICARLYLTSKCRIGHLQAYCILCKMHKLPVGCIDISQCAIYCVIYAQDLCKIAVISPMRNICTRFVQDCTSFLNVQYMCKVCARLYFFLQCAIYAQDLRNIAVISPMRNISERFVQDCTYFSNAQYMRKTCARLYLTSNLKL